MPVTVSVKRMPRGPGGLPPPVAVPLAVLPPCEHEGPVLEACKSCGGEGRHVRACLHPAPSADRDTCTREVVSAKVQACSACPDYRPALPPPAAGGIVVDHGAGGIGDGLLGLCAVARLSADHPGTPIEYRVSESARPFVALFDGYERLGRHARPHSEAAAAGARQMNVGYRRENRERYPVPRWERYAANVGAGGVTIPKLRDPARVKAAGADLAGRVALCPFSTDRTREWSLHHWLTLEALLTAAGYRTAVLHSDAAPLKPFAGAKVAGQSAERVAGVLFNACCAIGTDSGLSHLAGILGTPTVVLGGSTPVVQIFGAYPRVTCLQGALSCSACCGGTGVSVEPPFEERCRASCSNLQGITPERVMAAVDQVWLKETLACDAAGDYKSLLTADRLSVLRDEVLRTNGLDGDAAELGVYLGGSAKLIRHYAAGTLHLFDTFAGLPADDTEPGGHHVAGEFAGTPDEVRAFVGTEGVQYHIGTFPRTAPEGGRYRFVHLDADLFESTAAALAYFWPRMVSGGVLVLDDVGWRATPGVWRAIDAVLGRIEVETPARYQGVIRKPVG